MGKGYIDIAERDYEYFQQMIQMFQKTRDPYYNKVVVEAQQIVECGHRSYGCVTPA